MMLSRRACARAGGRRCYMARGIGEPSLVDLGARPAVAIEALDPEAVLHVVRAEESLAQEIEVATSVDDLERSRRHTPKSPKSDSNRRPLPYHGSALPTELSGRVIHLSDARHIARRGKVVSAQFPSSASVHRAAALGAVAATVSVGSANAWSYYPATQHVVASDRRRGEDRVDAANPRSSSCSCRHRGAGWQRRSRRSSPPLHRLSAPCRSGRCAPAAPSRRRCRRWPRHRCQRSTASSVLTVREGHRVRADADPMESVPLPWLDRVVAVSVEVDVSSS